MAIVHQNVLCELVVLLCSWFGLLWALRHSGKHVSGNVLPSMLGTKLLGAKHKHLSVLRKPFIVFILFHNFPIKKETNKHTKKKNR